MRGSLLQVFVGLPTPGLLHSHSRQARLRTGPVEKCKRMCRPSRTSSDPNTMGSIHCANIGFPSTLPVPTPFPSTFKKRPYGRPPHDSTTRNSRKYRRRLRPPELHYFHTHTNCAASATARVADHATCTTQTPREEFACHTTAASHER